MTSRVTPRRAATPRATSADVVVVGAGRVGRAVCERLRADGTRVRVVARDPTSASARALREMGCDVVEGDVLDERALERGLEGAEGGCVVAAFGAARIGTLADAWVNPSERDERHPRFVNYLGVERLARIAAARGVKKFVRITGASVGYPAFDVVAVLLNVVLSMTIRWQLRGEMAIREVCKNSSMKYVVVRPGNLRDGAPCAEAEGGNERVVLGSGGARVHAGKVSRSDVADVIVEAIRRPECANVTLTVAGSSTPSGGVRTELTWDPARGMHWTTVELEDTVREGVSFRDDSMWTAVAQDTDELKEKAHRRYVAMFLALLAGVFVLIANGAASLLARAFA